MMHVFGPLLYLWSGFDQERESYPDDENLNTMSTLFEQANLLLSQTFNSISYHRRENILSVLLESSTKVKEYSKPSQKILIWQPTNPCLGKILKAI